MKFTIPVALVVLATLAGCANTPVAYKVAKVTDHESRLLPAQFPLGITEEKLGEAQYRITAKLAEFGTAKRAYNMAIYHASVLAQEQGFNAFVLNKKMNANWCGGAKNNKSGGPTSKLEVTLVNHSNGKTSSKLFLVAEHKVKSKAYIDAVISEKELEKTSNERIEHCYNRSSKNRRQGRNGKKNRD